MEVQAYPRQWHPNAKVAGENAGDNRSKFKVTTYNVLCDMAIHSGSYEYCPKEHRYMATRHKHIMKDICYKKSDIVCFQEVEEKHWKDFLKADLDKEGYHAVHTVRELASNREGLVIGFLKDTFELLSEKGVALSEHINPALQVPMFSI